MSRVAVLISGRGSNLQALIDAQRDGLLGGVVAVVASNTPGAQGLERARAAEVPTLVAEHQGRPREDYDRELAARLADHGAELVCLAGFMRRLSAVFLDAFPNRVLNVHPSLLPAFPGRDAQRQALDYGVRVSGATVHLVDEGVDSGPILLQEAVPVLDQDTLESLSARILSAEHRIYPRAVHALLGGRFRIQGRRVTLDAA
jgi:phosphoribosylglycinamide formyltransferase 1